MPSTDLLILGGGLAGLSVAHAAAARGLGVCLVEQGDQLGAEASAQNAAMARRLVRAAPERDLAVWSHPFLRQPPWEGPPLLRPTGGLVAIVDPAQVAPMAAAASALIAAGVPVERDGPRPAALRGAHLAATFHVADDGLVDVHALVQGFATAPIRLRRGRPARLGRDGGRVWGVELDGERLTAAHTVIAGGAWTRRLLDAAGLALPLVPLARHLLQSAPHAASDPDHPWCWLDDAGLYVRPEGGGWLCSPCDEAAVEPPFGSGSARPASAEAADLAARKLLDHLPALADLRLRGGWSGLRTFAPDRHPLLGPDPRVAGLHLAAGLGGCGVSVAPAIGAIVLARLFGEALPGLDLAPFDPARLLG